MDTLSIGIILFLLNTWWYVYIDRNPMTMFVMGWCAAFVVLVGIPELIK